MVCIGSRPDVGRTFCHIKWTGERLSISGVEGPKANGDARGSCGQILDHLVTGWDGEPCAWTFEAGWSAELLAEFVRVWERWHLNDMRAGCEHQREHDVGRTVEVVSYGLTPAAYHLRLATRERITTAALKGELIELTATERALAELDTWFRDLHATPDADSPLSGCYEVKKREQKAVGWVTQNEHPEGMLSRPCDVCGYKYGSAWLKEEVPAEVLAFLQSLLESTIKPAWV